MADSTPSTGSSFDLGRPGRGCGGNRSTEVGHTAAAADGLIIDPAGDIGTQVRGLTEPVPDDGAPDDCPACGEPLSHGELITWADGHRFHTECLQAPLLD